MVVLGLHFGHDASVTILKDGEVLLCYEKERTSRIKHAIGLTVEDIDLCLSDANMSIEQVDFMTLTSTQLMEFVQVDKERMSLALEILPEHRFPCTMTDKIGIKPDQMQSYATGWLKTLAARPDHLYHRMLPGFKEYVSDDALLWGSFEHFVNLPVWDKVLTLEKMAVTDYRDVTASDDASYGLYYPASVTIRGRKFPAYVFAHHYAHAAYSYYTSPFSEAGIITHDGGGGGFGYGGGFFGYGKGHRFYPVTPHNLFAGQLYETCGDKLGIGPNSPGKLMGLSAYGKPRFFDWKFVGNWFDVGKLQPEAFFDHCVLAGKRMGYDMAPLGKREQILAPINVDIAASAQKLVDEIMLRCCHVVDQIFHNSGIGAVKNLCLSGGLALNCPANTRIWRESAFESVHVPPAVTDMGLSVGSALALYHNIMGNGFEPKPTHVNLAYQGLKQSCSGSLIDAAVEKFKSELNIERLDLGFRQAARDLADNKVIGWFEGRSEIGPRALGHRSILANPAYRENWNRVNKIKGRELWRPFAPAVLAERSDAFFTATQTPSHFMLLNALVTVNDLPAITHADRSARIQSVTPDNGKFYHLLKEVDAITGIPVVMNTSFNGPGEPIVETPENAIRFLLKTDLDFLYVGNYRLSKRSKA